jgi:hypothetical protein
MTRLSIRILALARQTPVPCSNAPKAAK